MKAYDEPHGSTVLNVANGFMDATLSKSKSLQHEVSEPVTMPIAIIGMSCRFPGDANSPEKLWKLCANAESAWSSIPKSRFNQNSWYHPEKNHVGTSYVKGGYFLSEDISVFDASFFNFSSETASTMDPQVRMQLESVYEALENAGVKIEDIAGTETSVYAGTMFRDYHDSLFADPSSLPRFFLTGNGAAMVSNRVSHFFDLRGPSLSVDTGCSTSLTALHLACQSLRTGDSKISIVGGSNALLNPDMFISGTSLGLLSPEGKCFAFDSRASGYGRGEGAATIVIKPLDDAIRDGDPVRAVIRETNANQDGKTPTLTSPSQTAQQELMELCYSRAGLDPSRTGYVEAHGTGTQAGDTTESHALGAVFGARRAIDNPILIGSIKTNIGHTEASSGLAGVIKVVLALEKGYIPPSINFVQANENINFHDLKLKLSQRLEPWPSSSLRRASVNNFGYGGANAHAIVEDPRYLLKWKKGKREVNGVTTNGVSDKTTISSRVFKFSAHDEVASRSVADNVRHYLQTKQEMIDDEDSLLDDLAYTLGQKRSHFAWNHSYSAGSVKELITALDPQKLVPRRSTQAPRLGFVFTGQGAQWHAMGRELIEHYSVFRDSLREADKCLKALGATWSLIDELMREPEETRVNEVIVSLPICVAVQISLVRLLRSWSVQPSGVAAHSSGEVAAAFAAGAIDLRSAMAIVYTRGSLTTKFQKIIDLRGGMLAVGLDRTTAQTYLSSLSSSSPSTNKTKLVVACVNSPSSTTISGDADALEELETILKAENIFARRLKVDAGYHSHHMLPIAGDYYELLNKTLRQESELGEMIYSSPTTGRRMYSAADISSPEHWVKNMVQPVEFIDSLRNLCVNDSDGTAEKVKPSVDIVIEVGPHGALAGPIRQNFMVPELKELGISYESCLTRGQSAIATMHKLACNLLERGYHVDLGAVNVPTKPRKELQVLHDLPPYPWNHHVRHWEESRINRVLRKRRHPPHDLLGIVTVDSQPSSRTWRNVIRQTELPWVRDHVIQSNVVYPGAGYISMVIEASKQSMEARDQAISGYHLRDVKFMNALVVPDIASGVEVQTMLKRCADKVLEAEGWQEFQISSVNENDEWTNHCEGLTRVFFESENAAASKWNSASKPFSTGKTQHFGGVSRNLDPRDIYRDLHSVGISHGPIFQNIISSRTSKGRSRCEFVVADTASVTHEQKHVIHPTTLDSVFQAVYTSVSSSSPSNFSQKLAMIPRTIKDIFISDTISSEAGHSFTAHSKLADISRQGFEASITVHSTSEGTDTSVIEVQGLHCQSLGETASPISDSDEGRLCFSTVWKRDISDLWHQKRPEVVTDSKLRIERAPASYEERVNTLIDLFAHKKPRSQILELGGGQGAHTSSILQMLSTTGSSVSSRWAKYVVTNECPENVQAAKEQLAAYGDTINYSTFEASVDLASQGFESGVYDLVIVSRIDSWSPSKLSDSLAHIRKLLRPNGKLLLLDNGFDISVDYEQRPLRSAEHVNATWNDILSGSDFNDIGIELQSGEDKARHSTIITASMTDYDAPAVYHPDVIIVYYKVKPPQEWLNGLQQALSAYVPGRILVQGLEEVEAKDKVCIFVGELEQAILQQPNRHDFNALQMLLTQAKDVLWVSKGAAINSIRPFAALHTGLLRTLRCEDTTKRYVTIDLDPQSQDWDADSANHVGLVYGRSFNYSTKPEISEFEYAVRSNDILIPRVYDDIEENDAIAPDSSAAPTTLLPFAKSGRDIRLGIGTPGLLDSLAFRDDPVPIELLPSDFVEISPAAFGLNFRDIMVAMGQLHESRMGFECSGVISGLGSVAISHGFKIGDPVYAFIRGHFSTSVRVHHTSVGHIPEGIDMESAASIALVFITAYHALHNLAHISKGETVLIHSGSGGVGQAAIMLAQRAGAEVFVTLGSQEKQEFVTKTYGVPPDHIFSSRNALFSAQIKSMTNGLGVDVVLNSLAGPLLRESWNCIASFGRFIEIGKRDLELNNNLEMLPFTRSVTFSSLDLITLGEMRGKIVAEVIAEINKLFNAKEIHTVKPITVFPISQVETAFRTMQAGKHLGKIILKPSGEDMVMPRTKSIKLAAESSYLIIGGLGGIGRSISRWLTEKGAKHLVLLSRRGASQSQDEIAFLNELRSAGANVSVRACDVANRAQLSTVLEECQRSLPPIKGVIQGAMVLRDSIFENMSFADWNTAIRPKVQASWNLHDLLSPLRLDFFIMLSSISGFGGNGGQANYAAGGTFQDALARYRASRNLPAVSIDLGMVKSVGVVAESRKIEERLSKLGLRPIEEDEVLRLIEAAIREPIRSVSRSQVVTGIPPRFVRTDTPVFWNQDVRFSGLERVAGSSNSSFKLDEGFNAAAKSLKARVVAAATLMEAVEFFVAALTKKLSEMFIVPESEVDPSTPLTKFGVDSLIAVELRNWIVINAEADVSIFEVAQSASLTALAGKVAAKSKFVVSNDRL